MRRSHLCVSFTLALLFASAFTFQAHAAPSGPLVKHLASLLKWTARSSYKPQQSEGNFLQFEDGYLVETVVEGNDIGVVPYKIHVSEDGELFAVDEVNSNVVKITPPLSQYSRARLVAGSFQGKTGHVDGKFNEACFNHPRGVTIDEKGNVYVADTLNLAIRKIGDAGVTTIAGGKSNVAGYRDGPSEDAKFSSDFDVVYVHSTCSLLVVDRGNAALRQISLNQEDCSYQSSSITVTDVLMVIGAVVAGYAICLLQQGFGSSLFSKMQSSGTLYKDKPGKEKPTPIVDSMKEEPRWPSFGQLAIDLSKLAFESLGSIFLYFVPTWFRHTGSQKGLTPLKDSLVIPEDEVDRTSVHGQNTPAPLYESQHLHPPQNTSEKYPEMKPTKIKSASFNDPSMSSKHRSLKRQEYAEFYGSAQTPPTNRSKSHKEKTRHRQRDTSGEATYGSINADAKVVEMKSDNSNPKFDHYNMRSKYGANSSYRF